MKQSSSGKKQTTSRFTIESDRWLEQQAIRQGISKNDVVQLLINKAMNEEQPNQPTENQS